MNIVSLIVVFCMVWWLAFFIALPVGIRSQQEDPSEPAVPGADPGAPVKPKLGKKALAATVAASLFTLIFWLLGTVGGVSLRALFGQNG